MNFHKFLIFRRLTRLRLEIHVKLLKKGTFITHTNICFKSAQLIKKFIEHLMI